MVTLTNSTWTVTLSWLQHATFTPTFSSQQFWPVNDQGSLVL